MATDVLKASADALKSKNLTAKEVYEKRGKDLTGGSVYWDPNGVSLPTTAGLQYSSETDLAHGYDANRGMLDNSIINDLRVEEWQAVYRENVIRSELNLPYRLDYGTKDENHNPLSVPVLDNQLKPILPAGYKL